MSWTELKACSRPARHTQKKNDTKKGNIVEFALKKNIDRSWDLTPLSGPFAGMPVAAAEGINLADVRFSGNQMVGVLKAVWGLSVLIEEVYEHPDMIRGLCVGKSFNADMQVAAMVDRDGYKDPITLRFLKGARRVMLLGQAIYTKGQF